MANKEIRRLLWEHHIPLWKVAEKVGRAEVTICRWLRFELDDSKRERVLSAINEIIKDVDNNG